MIGRLPSPRRPFRKSALGVASLVLLALVLSACGPTHIEPQWSSISEVAGGAQIMLAFGDRLSLVDTTDGRPVPLTGPDGQIRLDDQGNPRRWEVRMDGQQVRFYTTPVPVDEDTLLAASYDMRLLEIDSVAARIQGASHTFDQHIVSAPVRDGDRIYQGLSDHDLVALSADGLSEIWRVTTGHGVWASPLIVEDTIYFTSMDHNLYAVDKTTGDVLWQTDLQGAMTSAPVHEDGHLYVGSFAGKVFDVSAETGAILGEFPVKEWVWNAPALAEGILYVSDLSGSVFAIDTADGLTGVWETKVSNRATVPTPLVTDEYVIVGSRDSNVYWLDRESGAVVNTKAVAGEVLTQPLLIEPSDTLEIPEPLVIVSTAAPQEMLVAFTLDQGQRMWAYGR